MVQLARLELQQRERGDIHSGTKHALKQQLRYLIDVDWTSHNIPSVRVTVTLLQLAQIIRSARNIWLVLRLISMVVQKANAKLQMGNGKCRDVTI